MTPARTAVAFIAIVVACWAVALHAQQPKARIGILWPGDVKPWDEAFLDGLETHGYRSGSNAVIEIRNAVGSPAPPERLAAELAALDLDVIFVAPAALAKYVLVAVEKSGDSTPIVVLSYDPVSEGVVISPNRRNANITGVATTPAPDLMARHLQLLKDMIPKISHVAYLVDGTSDAGRFFGEKAKVALEGAGRLSGVRVTTVEVSDSRKLDQALTDVKRSKAQALIVAASPLFNTHRTELIQLATEQRLPAIYGAELFTRDGGLMSYWTSVEEMFRRAADMVDRVLRGTPAAEIPVEYPTRFRLVVNMKTAQALGLQLTDAVLVQADEIIR